MIVKIRDLDEEANKLEIVTLIGTKLGLEESDISCKLFERYGKNEGSYSEATTRSSFKTVGRMEGKNWLNKL